MLVTKRDTKKPNTKPKDVELDSTPVYPSTADLKEKIVNNAATNVAVVTEPVYPSLPVAPPAYNPNTIQYAEVTTAAAIISDQTSALLSTSSAPPEETVIHHSELADLIPLDSDEVATLIDANNKAEEEAAKAKAEKEAAEKALKEQEENEKRAKEKRDLAETVVKMVIHERSKREIEEAERLKKEKEELAAKEADVRRIAAETEAKAKELAEQIRKKELDEAEAKGKAAATQQHLLQTASVIPHEAIIHLQDQLTTQADKYRELFEAKEAAEKKAKLLEEKQKLAAKKAEEEAAAQKRLEEEAKKKAEENAKQEDAKKGLNEPLIPKAADQKSQCGCCRFWRQQSTCGKIIWGTLIIGVIAGAIGGTLAVLNNHSSGGNSASSTDLSYCTSMPWNGQKSGGTFCLYSTSGNRMVGRWMGDFNAEPETGVNPWGGLIPWDAKFAPVTQNPDGSYHYDVVASASDDILVQDQEYVCITMNLQQNVQSFTATNVKANTGTGPAPVSQMDKPCPPTVNAPKNREELARLQEIDRQTKLAAEKEKSSTRSITQSLARSERTLAKQAEAIVKAKTELNEHGLPVGLNYVNNSLPQKSFFSRVYEYVMGTTSAPSTINVLSNSL